MNLQFLRLEKEIELVPDKIATLQIENKAFFARAVMSLVSEAGEEALEPYRLWSKDGKKLGPKKALIVAHTLPILPINDRALLAALYDKVELLVNEDPFQYEKIEQAASMLQSQLKLVMPELRGTYEFGLQWKCSAYLKALSFLPDENEQDGFFEKCIRYLDLLADIGCSKPLVLVNAKSFLDDWQMQSIAETAFFDEISVLLLESWVDETNREWERKTHIDQHLIAL